jgi:hypothetical protein
MTTGIVSGDNEPIPENGRVRSLRTPNGAEDDNVGDTVNPQPGLRLSRVRLAGGVDRPAD